jgi:hypothetical protein
MTEGMPEGIEPPPLDGAKAYPEFLSAVGEAITIWAIIDQELFEIFVWATQTNRVVAATLFYRIKTISEHFELVDKILALVLSGKSHKVMWEEINRNAKAIVNFRNELAHNPVAIYSELSFSEGRHFPRETGFVIVKSAYKQLYKRNPFFAKINDIREHIKEVTAIRVSIYNFAISKKRRKVPRAESHLQATAHKSGRAKRTAPNSAKLKRPPRSSRA